MNTIDYNMIKKLEERFIRQSIPTLHSFFVKKGEGSTIISAPHSVPQLREGKIKQGEFLTGVIAQLLHEWTGCHVIYKTRNDNDDANFDKVNPYKDELISFIRENKILYLLDIHIMSPEREYLIELGTAKGRNVQFKHGILTEIEAVFVNSSIRNIAIDQLFTAGNPNTVSSTIARECQIFSLQIEINWSMLDIDNGGIADFQRICDCLARVISVLHKKGSLL